MPEALTFVSAQQTPTRGKDLPLQALEDALTRARDELYRTQKDLDRAKYGMTNAIKNEAIARRDLEDVKRAIEAVRIIPTLPLIGFQKDVKKEVENSSE